jgi:hypothetical protein
MDGLCFRQQEDMVIKFPNVELEKTLTIAETPIKNKLMTKSKRKKRSQSANILKPIKKIPSKIEVVNIVLERKITKKKVTKSSIKNINKITQKKARKNNFMKKAEQELTKEELKVAEKKSSPTTTAACSERPESRDELHREDDYLRDSEITDIIFLQDKEQILPEFNCFTPNQKRRVKEKQFFPFMRKLHCEIAYTARIASSYCEEILPICNKIKDYIDFVLKSINTSKLIIDLIDAYTIIYGSMATKLACEHSDLDLAVCGFILRTCDELRQCMNWLNAQLSSLISSSFVIHTARVPLITAVSL